MLNTFAIAKVTQLRDYSTTHASYSWPLHTFGVATGVTIGDARCFRSVPVHVRLEGVSMPM